MLFPDHEAAVRDYENNIKRMIWQPHCRKCLGCEDAIQI